MNESAVEFETASRVHVGLAVRDLKGSIAFYRLLLGQEPAKERPGYAKFEIAEPPVNLSLNQSAGATRPSNPVTHFGIQVKTTAAVREMADRLKAGAAAVRVEENVTCCYAVQNKVWTVDPDGNKWEVYVVLDDGASSHSPDGERCCEPTGRAQPGGAAPAAARCC